MHLTDDIIAAILLSLLKFSIKKIIMILAISGTPGTGKTAVAKILAKKLNANLISIQDLVNKIKYEWDEKRKTKIVDVKDLQKAVDKHITRKKINIIDGHLSHLLRADIVVVLRCAPDLLEKRLKRKKWNTKKITENVKAEILDEATIEAIERNKNTFEIDTSTRHAAETADIISKLLNNIDTKKYRAGKIDWSERYKDYLMQE